MGVFFSDTFTAADGTDITAHTPDVGTSWVVETGWTTGFIRTNQYSGTNGATGGNDFPCSSDVAASADGYVQADFNTQTSFLAADLSGIGFRKAAIGTDSHYYIFFTNGQLFLNKDVAGTSTTLGSVTLTETSSTTYTLRLAVIGASLNAYLISGAYQQANLMSVTDASVTNAGRVDMFARNTSTTTGIWLANLIGFDTTVPYTPGVANLDEARVF